ncbi:MAG: hypothetical protein HYU62_13505 [Caulobacterales bacterium]|nr:hypothetical protein [Caulobacterales bacterium]
MTRSRSPGYPNFSLGAAVKRAERIFAADRKNPIEREVAAQHMGYAGISGAADKALATMMHYGLLERVGKGQVKVAQRAIDILHPSTDAERRAALREAAFRPQLFATLQERFPDGASESTLRSFLVREDFLERAIGPALSAYEETCSFLKQEGAYGSRGPDEPDEEELGPDDYEDPAMNEVETITRRQPPPPPLLPPAPGADIPPGMRKFVINLPDGGDAILAYPAGMTAEGYQDLEDYLSLFFKKAKRATPPPAEDDDLSSILG